MNKAVFLDRDGTINKEVDYLSKIDEFEFLPQVIRALQLLSGAPVPYKIIIITNQSGIGRGYFDKKTLEGIHESMRKDLGNYGVQIDGIYYCPHHPDLACECRKPKTGMIENATKGLDIDFKSMYFTFVIC